MFNEGGIVGCSKFLLFCDLMRFLQQRFPKDLRRLHRPETFARRCFNNEVFCVRNFNRLFDRHGCYRGTPFRCRVKARENRFVSYKRTDTVMDNHEIGIRWKRANPVMDRLLPRCTAGDKRLHLLKRIRCKHSGSAHFKIGFVNKHKNFVNGSVLLKPLNRMR